MGSKQDTIRKINIASWTLLLLSGIFIFSMPTAHAKIKTDLLKTLVDFINSGVIGIFKQELGSSSPLFGLVTGNDGIVATMYNTMTGVGALACIAYGMAHMYENMERGMDPKESVVKMLRELFLVTFFIMFLPDILNKIMEFGIVLMDIVCGLIEDTEEVGLTLGMILGSEGDAPEKIGMWKWIVALLELAIPALLTLLMCAVALFQSFSLIIEIAIRRAFAPMAVANIYGEGLRSPGMRYLLRYMAVFLKIVIALFVSSLGVVLMGLIGGGTIGSGSVSGSDISGVINAAKDNMTNMLMFLMKIVAVNFTVIGVITKAGEYANDIAGV